MRTLELALAELDALADCVQSYSYLDEFIRESPIPDLTGFAWERLRRGSPRPALLKISKLPVFDNALQNLVESGDGLSFCRNLDTFWDEPLPIHHKTLALLLAARLLAPRLPQDFFLPIEVDIVFILLSPLYRKLRVLSYNSGSYILQAPPGRSEPRWQPFLNGLAFDPNTASQHRPDTLMALTAMHELGHVICLTKPPLDPLTTTVPTHYIEWITANESFCTSIQRWTLFETLSRLPHPYFYSLFNYGNFQLGHILYDPLPPERRLEKYRADAERILAAWTGFDPHEMIQRSVPEDVQEDAGVTDEVARYAIDYALRQWPKFALGLRARFMQMMLPERPTTLTGPTILTKLEDLWYLEPGFDSSQRAREVSLNNLRILAWQTAEIHDLLWKGDPESEELPSLEAWFAELNEVGACNVMRPASALEQVVSRRKSRLRILLDKKVRVLDVVGVPRDYLELHPLWALHADL